MLRNMKAKALALLTALAMMLGLGAVASTAAYAAGTEGSIAVTGNDAFTGISVYRMFDQQSEGVNEKYVLNESWKGFFTAAAGQGGIGLTDGNSLSDAAYTYVKTRGGNDAANVTAFAKKAAAWAQDPSHQITATSSSGTTPAPNGKKTATVSDLAYGYYLVVPNPKGSTDPTTPSRGTDAMLVNVNSATAVTMDLKTVYPTVTKTVGSNNDNHASASVGDKLNFTLTSTVPDISEYPNGYQFSFVDTLSSGLTYNADSLTVKIGTETVATTSYNVVTPSAGNNNTLTINFGTLKDGTHYDATSLFTGKAGQTITVTYTATLNENAQIAIDNTNTVHVEYTNNPNFTGTGSSGDSTTHQYTFKFDLNKTDGTNGLAGAKFKLQDSEGTDIKLVNAGSDTYRPAKVDEQGTALTEVTTPEGGVIHFTGLAEGTYQLVETTPPDGYNKVADPITVRIEATYDQDGILQSWSVNSNGQNPVEVVNHAGTILPGTGGIGTVVFTVAGIVLIVAGVAWAMRRRQRD